MTVIPPPILELPLTPFPGTTDPNPLVSVQQYVDVTSDIVSDDDDITESLDETIIIVSQECNRTIAYGQYSEVKYLYRDGKVYPSAVPIDPTKPITSNTVIYDPSQGVQSPASIIQGWGVWVGWFTPLPWMPVFSGVLAPQTVVTYYGGYTQATLPPRLRRLICRIAYRLLNPAVLPGIPAGATAVSVNGVSVSGNLSPFALTDPGIRNELLAYTRPDVEAWQS